jgi:hypothetical protein
MTLLIALCLSAVSAVGQDDVKEAPSLRMAGETYRLRVQNTELGCVEISADGGLHYLLIGRVQRAATGTVVERGANTPGIVLRSGADGLAFTVGAGRVVKLRPAPRPLTGNSAKGIHLPAPAIPSEIATNLPAGNGLFGDLMPLPNAVVRLQSGSQTLVPLTDAHVLAADEVYVFIVSLPNRASSSGTDAQQAEIGDRIAALARSYAAGAAARARSEGKTVYSGTLTLRAQLPTGEPDPIAAVTYTVDDDLIAAQNVGPYVFGWDTRHVPDGEHLVEISALNLNGRVITRARTLIVVDNGRQTGRAK